MPGFFGVDTFLSRLGHAGAFACRFAPVHQVILLFDDRELKTLTIFVKE